MSEAILSPESGFQNASENRNILKAGSASVRSDFANDLVYYIRSNGPAGYSEFAPKIIEEDDKVAPSSKTKKRVQAVEEKFRELIFRALNNHNGTKWFSKLPKDVKMDIQFRVEEKEILGAKYEDPPTVEYLYLTDTNHLFKIMSARKTTGVQFFKDKKNHDSYIPLSEIDFKHQWKYYSALRNLIAHHNEYPSENSKEGMLFHLGLMENYLRMAEDRIFSEEE